MRRCFNPAPKDRPYWVDRGITVCGHWHKFENFLADMGHCPPGLELDRINGDKNYEPGNCRWTDEVTQSRNQRPRRKGYHKRRTLEK